MLRRALSLRQSGSIADGSAVTVGGALAASLLHVAAPRCGGKRNHVWRIISLT